jgi:DNA-binding NarL/FixJ family response regulator
MVRLGLVACLRDQPDLEVVGETGQPEAALILCREFRPDVLILDLGLEGDNGRGLLSRVREVSPETHVIGLAGRAGEDQIASALLGGAVNCLLESVSARELAEAVRAAGARRRMISGTAAQILIEHLDRLGRQEASLTMRQSQVLQLVARGLTNPQIAAHLGIRPATVRMHVGRIMGKLGAASRTEAVTLAFRQGLVRLD